MCPQAGQRTTLRVSATSITSLSISSSTTRTIFTLEVQADGHAVLGHRLSRRQRRRDAGPVKGSVVDPSTFTIMG
ncbi:MAG: hypothetical protein LC799_05435 [Actinobacteria bacterium]|nr:hypothetical protein [Actinomycetota bacterium]